VQKCKVDVNGFPLSGKKWASNTALNAAYILSRIMSKYSKNNGKSKKEFENVIIG